MHARHRRAAVSWALALVASAIPATGAQAQQRASWGVATAVDAVNSGVTEGCPMEAPDGRSVYLMSTRGAGGDQDIWVSARDRDGSLQPPQMLPAPVNSDANDFCPTPLRGKSLLFVSNRGGIDAEGALACGGGDIYLTRLSPATGNWAEPRNLGCAANGGPNGPGNEFGPSVVETEDGTWLFYSTGGAPGSNTQQIVMSRMLADGTFGPGQPVAELNSSSDDMMPNVRKDGLEIVFASNRSDDQHPVFDIWSSTRTSGLASWSPPVKLGTAVNGPASETRPALSWDGSRLYFGRAGDIYVSTR